MQQSLHYFSATAVFLFILSANVFSQNVPDDIQVQLSFTDQKTVYQIGEPIRLVLTFTTKSAGKYNILLSSEETVGDPDEVLLSPSKGAFGWAAQYQRGKYYMKDYFGYATLDEKPINVERALNNIFRFDKPGKYSVVVRTKRVSTVNSIQSISSPLSLTTNAVSFEIKPMNETEETQEVQRLSSLLDASGLSPAEEIRASEKLAFLTGDVSAREKVKRIIFSPKCCSNYYVNIYHGLFIARNRPLVINLLEEAFRDINRPVSFQLVNTLVQLRFLQENSEPPAGALSEKDLRLWREKGTAEIKRNYLKELVESLPKRAGESRTATAITILDNLPRENPPPDVLSKLREIILADFDNLHPFAQWRLLYAYWNEMRDVSLLPSIERMLTNNRDSSSWQFRATGINRLMELAPERARPFVVYELLEPSSFADFDILKKLKDPFLPETDAALLERIRRHGGEKIDNTHLGHATLRTARFATASVYDDLMQIYKTYGTKWGADARGALLAYFARHNEKEAISLIEKELEGLKEFSSFSFLSNLTSAYYSEEINELLKRRLESDDPNIASLAAYLISKYGEASNEQLLRARLTRWRKEWSRRIAEIDDENSDRKIKSQATVERELILGLIRAEAPWKLSDDEKTELKQSCLTKLCRQAFPTIK
jgi:hypothetical protein